MFKARKKTGLLALLVGTACLWAHVSTAQAESAYDPGASDTEIKIGMTAPLSGPASAYGMWCHGSQAAITQRNEEQGGVNGRKITLLCEDDQMAPARALEKNRKLVESDEVLFMFSSVGTAANTAVKPYLASRKVPQVLVASGASTFADPANSPWSTIQVASYHSEAVAFAEHIKLSSPNAKVGILYQNDDYGKEYVQGLTEGFGEEASTYIVGSMPAELSDPSVDSQVLKLHASGVDTVVLAVLNKHSSQAIRRIGELSWKPTIYLNESAASVSQVLLPAGKEASTGVISTATMKKPADPAWADDEETLQYKAFVEKYLPGQDYDDRVLVYAYATTDILFDILERAGDNLTRDNIRDLAQTVDMKPRMYLDGVMFKTTPEDVDPVESFQMIQFDGAGWKAMGDIVTRN